MNKNWLREYCVKSYFMCRRLFSFFKAIGKKLYLYKNIREFRFQQKRALISLKGRKPLKCVFFVVFHQVWKYDEIYKIMSMNPNFDPLILMCPVVNRGREDMLYHLKEGYEYFKSLNYNVLLSYNCSDNKYVDVIKDLDPDIIFYTNPYKGLIDDRYYITNFKQLLTVYVPYAFDNTSSDYCYKLPLCNYVWRYYIESEEHLIYSQKKSYRKGQNVVVTGYPGIETLIKKDYVPQNKDWKIKDPSLKRIIWAPHHTIEPKGQIIYSCFLKYAEFMVKMAEKYSDKVQFVFKPHPILKNKLVSLWGEEKTCNYYALWKNMPNCNLNDEDYMDLFLTSDGMIHDCGSFLIEYLYVNKPVMRMLNEIPVKEQYNEFTLKCLEHYYLARKEQDIEMFIQNIINGVDPLKEQRTEFVIDVLKPKGSPSQNIVNDIIDSIDNQILYRN